MKRHKTILALGADIKSRFCVYQNSLLRESCEFGDLSIADNFARFSSAVGKIHPDIVAYDMHPGYFSTRIATALRAPHKLAVQHHHAHIGSVLIKSSVTHPVIGIAFDGTGYGTDGAIWGGEFFVVDNNQFKRVAHLCYAKMPGAERVIREPWRMALSLLYECFGDDIFSLKLPLLTLRLRQQQDIIITMIRRGINAPLTSSIGRLFDAVASILDVCHVAGAEAQAAIALEKLAQSSLDANFYDCEIISEDGCLIIPFQPIIKGIVADLTAGVAVNDIARRFHTTLAVAIEKTVAAINQKYKIQEVVVSGGVFQNTLLFNSVKKFLSQKKYTLLNNSDAILTDAGICRGQVYAALNEVKLCA